MTAIVSISIVTAVAAAPHSSAERPIIVPGQLPEPAAPAPPDPTEQRNACSVFSPATDGPAVPTGLRDLDFASAWPITRGGGQVVAVIDTGVSPHPRLSGLRPGGDYVSDGDGLSDCDGHGTLVAGLIAARPDGSSGFAGGAPDADILSIRQSSNVFQRADKRDRDESDAQNAVGYGNVATMAMAVRTAADSGATVINISEVACIAPGLGVVDGPLGAAIRYATRDRNVVVVAAAGNVGSPACKNQNPAPDPARPTADLWENVNTIATPAWFDDVLTVGSVDPTGTASDFSLAGPWVDVAAPGRAAVSLSPTGQGLTNGSVGSDGQLVPIDGTSFAAPLVSAVAALVRAHRPELTAAQVIRRIEETAHRPAEGWNPIVGHGVVDPLAAVTAYVPGIDPDGNRDDTAGFDDNRHDLDVANVPVAAPAPPPAPNHGPRTTATVGAAVVGVIVVAGLALSAPFRRRPH